MSLHRTASNWLHYILHRKKNCNKSNILILATQYSLEEIQYNCQQAPLNNKNPQVDSVSTVGRRVSPCMKTIEKLFSVITILSTGKKIYVDNTLKGNAMDFPVWCYGNYAKTSSKQSKKSPGELYTCNSCNCIHVIVIVNSACVIRLCFVNYIWIHRPWNMSLYFRPAFQNCVESLIISPRYCFSAPRQKRRWAGKNSKL